LISSILPTSINAQSIHVQKVKERHVMLDNPGKNDPGYTGRVTKKKKGRGKRCGGMNSRERRAMEKSLNWKIVSK